MSADVITAKAVQQWYPQKKGLRDFFAHTPSSWVKAVDNVSFSLKPREVLGVIGESGCGKSTLGRLLVRLEKPFGGQVLLNGEDVEDVVERDPLSFRRQVQIVFQNPFETFDPRHSIGQILSTPLKLHGIGANDNERLQICAEGLRKLGLAPAEDYLSRWPHELSGGQLQRISVLRAMQLDPKFIVADEPVSMLDVSVRSDLLNILLELIHEKDTAMVFISHDIAVTRYVSNNIAVMYLGRVVESGETDEVIQNPQHPYTKVLISNFPTLEVGARSESITIHGEPPTPIDPGPGCYFAPRCYACVDECRKTYPEMREVRPGHWASCHRI
ncbi:MAG: oligopeptide/dipeptide ABC transporter ATP-binding protein [Bacillota bacterium]|jgi:oligopeptide/dipeptide ABC transporter ATP-binding protein